MTYDVGGASWLINYAWSQQSTFFFLSKVKGQGEKSPVKFLTLVVGGSTVPTYGSDTTLAYKPAQSVKNATKQ